MKRCNKRQSGFVLLVALMVLTIAGTVLAATARYCGNQALVAGDRCDALQLKWGTISCRAVCLPLAGEIIKRQSSEQERPFVVVHRSVLLGDTQFDLVFGDEQAKANVNLLHQRFGQSVAEAGLASLQQMRSALQVRLTPAEPSPVTPTRYTCPAQVFVFQRPDQLMAPESEEAMPLEMVTCWGSGKLNVSSASSEVIRAVTPGLLDETQAAKLCQFRNENPAFTLNELLAYLEMDKDARTELQSVLTDSSRCYSLWVVARGTNRSWYRLYVDQRGNAGDDARQWTFQW